MRGQPVFPNGAGVTHVPGLLCHPCARLHSSRVDQACARSLDLDVVDVMRIDRMLARALEAQPTPGPTRPWRTGTVLRFARPESDFAPVRKWKEMPDDDPL